MIMVPLPLGGDIDDEFKVPLPVDRISNLCNDLLGLILLPVDRISNLCNDLLGLILSSLTMKEAAATSILSRRWRYLWTLSPTLDLDGITFLERVNEFPLRSLEFLEKKRSEYVRWVDRVVGCSTVRWVDRVVGCSTAERLVEFRLWFDLTNKHTTHIDVWLHFAVSRKVERLELNLTERVSCQMRRECYNFPYGKWNFPVGLKTMKKLFTHNVNVSGEAVEFFLGNCPLLEQLTVSRSGHLTALQIIRTFPSFKCLEISLCNDLDSLVIRDSDLVTLKYCGKRILDFQLLNVPLLTQLWINGQLPMSMKNVVEMFSPLLPQLQMFNIYFTFSPSWDETKIFLSAARMSNLKQLEVTVGFLVIQAPTLVPLINLISASPCLQRFVVQVDRVDREVLVTTKYMDGKYDERAYPNAHLKEVEYPHLKEVEFVGYRNKDIMFDDLIMHFGKNDVALETIVVDPRCFQILLDRPWIRNYTPRVEEEMLARAYAKEQLTKHIHPKINVKIL